VSDNVEKCFKTDGDDDDDDDKHINPSGALIPSDFTTNMMYSSLLSPTRSACPSHFKLPYLYKVIIRDMDRHASYKL
jgi:hypothetical protein